MTEKELLKKYNIPTELMEKYRKLRKCSIFNDEDAENVSMIMTLYDIGFDDNEAEKYIRLYFSGRDTTKERLAMLVKKRKKALSDIHLRQKQLDLIDYIRYKISKENIKD